AQFVRMVQETPVGRKADMQVWRGGARQSMAATIGARAGRPMGFGIGPSFPPEKPGVAATPHCIFLGGGMLLVMEVGGVDAQLAEFVGVKEGVLVRSVTKGSAAETAGLKAGDVITKVENQMVSSPRNLTPALRKSGKNVNLTVVRNHKEMSLNVKLSQN